jgi:hypothetical protein
LNNRRAEKCRVNLSKVTLCIFKIPMGTPLNNKYAHKKMKNRKVNHVLSGVSIRRREGEYQ